ncbi:MAG: hypothetical protein QHH04_00600 [Methanolinea sp.]|nr:hypothetical protein [Methanolinea sp.]
MCSPCCHDIHHARRGCCQPNASDVPVEVKLCEELKSVYLARIEALDRRIASLKSKGSE